MTPELVELALKKQRLQLKSAALREEFAAQANDWVPVFTLADQVRAAVSWLARHPALPLAAFAALLAARPRAVLRSLGRAWLLWHGVQRVRAALGDALSSAPSGR